LPLARVEEPAGAKARIFQIAFASIAVLAIREAFTALAREYFHR
jgi:hypothetical protein